MDILNLVQQHLGDDAISALSQQIGGSPEATKSAVQSALPSILSAMSLQNDGKKSIGGSNANIMNLLDSNNDGSVLDDVMGFIKGGNDTHGGSSIINTLFGNKRGAVEQSISQNSGLNTQASSNLLNQLGPLVMNMLGNQKKQAGGGFDIGSILSMVTKQGGGKQGGGLGMITSLLDKDGDGNVMEEAVGMLGKLFGRKKR